MSVLSPAWIEDMLWGYEHPDHYWESLLERRSPLRRLADGVAYREAFYVQWRMCELRDARYRWVVAGPDLLQ